MNKLSFAAAAVLAGSALGGSVGPDLVITDVDFFDIRNVGNRYEIGYRYELMNAGDAPVDFQGNADIGNDTIGLQTYLATNPDMTGPVVASGGSTIFEPVVLQPGEMFEGILYSNTMQTPVPTVLNDYVWLVVDMFNTGESDSAMQNNRVVVRVPVPCGPADRAAPFGQLDLADVAWFAERFLAGNDVADVNNDGLLDLTDIVEFVDGFYQGCGGIE